MGDFGSEITFHLFDTTNNQAACLFSVISDWSEILYELAMAGKVKEAAKKAAEEKKAAEDKKATKVAKYKEKFRTRARLPRAAKIKNLGPDGTSCV